MSIKNAVTRAIARIVGNQPIKLADLGDIRHDDGKGRAPTFAGDAPILTPDQIRRALRDMGHVKRRADGTIVVKGRRVSR